MIPRILALALLVGVPALQADGLVPALSREQAAEARGIIAGFKANRRGPFHRIRWFCNDGTDHPASSNPCKERGGGRQHASLSAEAKKLASWGIDVGTVLAAMDFEGFFDADRDQHRLKQLVLEQYLEQIDEGWIYRRAYSYRGARQAEGEERAGRRLLRRLLSDPEWVRKRYLLAGLAVEAVPHGRPDSIVLRSRGLSKTIAAQEPRFHPIRAKIHSAPDERDLGAVEKFLAEKNVSEPVRKRLEELAGLLGRAYRSDRLRARLAEVRKRAGEDLGRRIDGFAEALEASDERAGYVRTMSGDFGPLDLRAIKARAASSERAGYRAGGFLSVAIAGAVEHSTDGKRNLELLDLNLLVQEYGFRAGLGAEGRTRRALLTDLAGGLRYVRGGGWISQRQLEALEEVLERLPAEGEVGAEQYVRGVLYLSRVTEWARATTAREFGPLLRHYSVFEPKAASLVDHLLRGSTGLGLSGLLQTLVDDANRIAGLRHSIFGSDSSSGVIGLNPGTAEGELAILREAERAQEIDADKIYVIPQTASDLKPMAGVLSLDRGNALSHAQLLAANLGIPNAVIGSALLPRLEEHEGKRVHFSVSRRGAVVLREAPREEEPNDGAAEAKFERIHLDTSRLELSKRSIARLADLSSRDAGVIVGPKAANLGGLKSMFPERVAPGLAIPFGVYVEHIGRKQAGEDAALGERIRAAFEQAETMRRAGAPEAEVRAFIYPKLAGFRKRIQEMDLLPRFERELRQALREVFGEEGTYGVFVRSDTNAEDLPEFTGAGLNLTVPNVVGTEAILQAVKDVWASPLSERAYLWRSRFFLEADRAYPSVLVMQTVASEKSGVIATVNLVTGARDEITVNVSEGVAAVVDGGTAESLLLLPDQGVRLLEQARVTYRKVADPRGGVRKAPPRGAERLLSDEDIAQIRRMVADVNARYPASRDERGEPLPFDIEFGFERGRLRLFQIRPLVRWKSFDAAPTADELAGRGVNLDEVPG